MVFWYIQNSLYIIGILCFFIYTPLCWVRNLEKLNWTHIVAIFIILFTMIVIVIYTGIKLAKDGIRNDIVFINSNTFLNVIGFSVYAYEGIGIIIPV